MPGRHLVLILRACKDTFSGWYAGSSEDTESPGETEKPGYAGVGGVVRGAQLRDEFCIESIIIRFAIVQR